MLMQQCIVEGQACKHEFSAYSGTTVSRRSIAYNFTNSTQVNVALNLNVTAVTSASISYTNQSSNIQGVFQVNHTDRIILAAGALTSPKLLGMKTFYGYNHYYATRNPTSPTDPLDIQWLNWLGGNKTQIFDYNGDIEYNYALLSHLGQTMPIKIIMDMKPKHRVLFDTEAEIIDPNTAGSPDLADNPWHYMGTVNHARMHIAGKMYSGDAGALKTPFNCHTSMPAAAAGIMAVGAAAGITPEDPPADSSEGYWRSPVLFATGILVAGLGRWRTSTQTLLTSGSTPDFQNTTKMAIQNFESVVITALHSNAHKPGFNYWACSQQTKARGRKQSLMAEEFSYHTAFALCWVYLLHKRRGEYF